MSWRRDSRPLDNFFPVKALPASQISRRLARLTPLESSCLPNPATESNSYPKPLMQRVLYFLAGRLPSSNTAGSAFDSMLAARVLAYIL